MSGIDLLSVLDAEIAAFREKSADRENTRGTGGTGGTGKNAGSPSGSPNFSNQINSLEGWGNRGTEKRKTRDTRARADSADIPPNVRPRISPYISLLFSKTVPPVPPNRKTLIDHQLNGGTGGGTDPISGSPDPISGSPDPGSGMESTSKLQFSSACRLPVTPDDWRAWLDNRLRDKLGTGNYADPVNAVTDAWNDALSYWHHAYGTVPPRTACGACGEVLDPWVQSIPIIDGARVHASWECLDGYGERCRQEAASALAEMGLTPPD